LCMASSRELSRSSKRARRATFSVVWIVDPGNFHRACSYHRARGARRGGHSNWHRGLWACGAHCDRTGTITQESWQTSLVILAAEEYSSPLEIAYVLVVVVLGWYVLPRVVIPALGRWMTRRRGGPPSERVTRTSTAIMAVMLTAFVIAASWNRDLGRPTVGALLALVVSMLFALWWRDNRRGD
jgi:hypothetical protein